MKWIMCLLLGLSKVYAAEVTLYAINSPHPLNWESPRSLLISTLRSSINPTRQGRSNHTIGHAYLGLKCDGETEVISGMTSGKGFSSRTNLFKNGHGLSIILQDNPGHFQDTVESRKDIEFFAGLNRMSIIKLIVSNDQCLKAREWYTEFAARENPIYGGVARRPLTGEGAGCTAYVMSFLEYADLNYAFFNKIFEQTIYIPNEVLGGDYGPNKVSIGDISGNRKKLSVMSENSLEVKLYDPNRMYFWILAKWNEVKNNSAVEVLPEYKASTEMYKKSKVLVLEKSPEL